jgi:exopolysaccharide biosynthesis polyprenyl glycosylphosphotransferase
MFTYRLRGLLNLHIFATTALAAGFFVAFAALTRYLPWLQLSPDVKILMCVLAIVAGMALSGRFVTAIGWRFHELGWPDAAWLATRQVAMVTLVLFTLIVATKDRSTSRVFMAVYLAITWVLLAYVNRRLPRFLADLAFSRLNRLPTLFMGHDRHLDRLNDWVARKRHLGVVPVGYLSDEHSGRKHDAIGPCLGATADLADAIVRMRIGQVVLLDLPQRDDLRRILATCQAEGCRLLVYDNIAERMPVPMIPVLEEGQSFYTAQEEPLEDPFNRAVKRMFDILVSLPVVAIVLPPLCLLAWIMQRIQAPGPLFFVRPRGGRLRSEFRMVKFRSMRDEKRDTAREAVQARAGDDRVYPFGLFMRRTSMDEFPQFWNVLIGDMSVVGPRPHLPKHDDEFSRIDALYRTRHLVKPGITGLAQIRGFRGEITDPVLLKARVEMDIHYITHWSIWLDVGITIKTLLHVLKPPKAAY